MDAKLAQMLDTIGVPSPNDDGWGRLGFLRNPYPTKSSPLFDVFHNQASVRDRFYADLVEFLKPPHPTTTLLFTGGNRVGKTHFMEHHRLELVRLLGVRRTILPIAVSRAESANLAHFYFDVVDQLAESLRLQTGYDLFEALPDRFDALKPSDLKRALETLSASSDRGTTRGLLHSWVRGERLRLTQRKELGVFGLVDSPSQIQSTFSGIVRYLQDCNWAEDGIPRQCPGVLVFVDEFELIWRQRRDRRDQFLQGLRALVDECAGGGLFLCVGMATGIGPEVWNLEGEYPAFYARLKGTRDIPALVEIESGVVGIEYARAFEDYGRKAYLAQNQTGHELPPASLFSDREIDAFFRELVGSARGATVTQADFFDKLHLEAENRRRQ